MNQAEQLARKARTAARLLAAVNIRERNDALQRVTEALIQEQTAIAEANQRDIARSKTEGLAAPLLKRLLYDEGKIQATVAGIKDLIRLADPLGRLSLDTELDDGLAYRSHWHYFRVTAGCVGADFDTLFEKRQ